MAVWNIIRDFEENYWVAESGEKLPLIDETFVGLIEKIYKFHPHDKVKFSLSDFDLLVDEIKAIGGENENTFYVRSCNE